MAAEKQIVKITLHQMESRWGTLSMDPFCSAAQTYCKMANIPYEVENDNNEGISATGRLPILQVENEKTYQEDDIYPYLKNLEDISIHLPQDKRSVELSLVYLVEEPLYQSMLYSWWMTDNYYDIKEIYGSYYPFPIRYYIVNKKYREMKSKLDILGVKSLEKALDAATAVYNILTSILGMNRFFFGDRPSFLDAIVYGHLSVQYFAILKNNHLKELIDSKFPQLKQYILRLSELYLPSVPSLEEIDLALAEADKKRDLWGKAIFVAAVGVIGIMITRSAFRD